MGARERATIEAHEMNPGQCGYRCGYGIVAFARPQSNHEVGVEDWRRERDSNPRYGFKPI